MNPTASYFQFGTTTPTASGAMFDGAVIYGNDLTYDAEGPTGGEIDRIEVQSHDAAGTVTVYGSYDGLAADAANLNAAFAGTGAKWFDPSLYFDMASIFGPASSTPTQPDDPSQGTQADGVLAEGYDVAPGDTGNDLHASDIMTDGDHTKVSDTDAATDTLTLLTGDVLTRAELSDIFSANAAPSGQHIDSSDDDGHSFALFTIDIDDIAADRFIDHMPDTPKGTETDFAEFLDMALL